MKNEDKKLLINLGILVFISALVIVLIALLVPTKTIDKVFGKRVNAEWIETDFVTLANDEELVLTYKSANIKTKSGENYGALFHVNNENAFGNIKLYIGITTDDLLTVEVDELNQTADYVNGIYGYVYEFYKKVSLDDVKNIPKTDVSDVTADGTASASTSEIKVMVLATIAKYKGETPEPGPTNWYGDAELVDDSDFAPTDDRLTRKIYKDGETIVGYQYRAVGSGIAENADDVREMNLLVEVDTNGVFKAYSFDPYGHSTGSWKRNVDNALKALIGTNIKDFDDTSVATGSTNSWTLVKSFLSAIIVEVNK